MAISNENWRMKNLRRSNLEKCKLQLHNIFLSFLLSENWLLKYKHLYVYIVFL
jgi:hypothetical protein